jgi:hypothetical protein
VTFLFDLLHVYGDDLLDSPLEERAARLAQIAPQLFFDLVFVFAFTQVTSLLVDDRGGVGCSAGCWLSQRSVGRGACTRG